MTSGAWAGPPNLESGRRACPLTFLKCSWAPLAEVWILGFEHFFEFCACNQHDDIGAEGSPPHPGFNHVIPIAGKSQKNLAKPIRGTTFPGLCLTKLKSS
jgi:hypothetical protein